jgi:hypothetical protein
MNKLLFTEIISCLILSGCGPGQWLGPTLTPSPTITPNFTPTPTPFPESSFSVEIVGFGEHGAMLKLIYSGNITEIQNNIRAVIKQGNATKDESDFENIDGRLLAEMTDAKYQLGDINITLEIANGNYTQRIEKTTQYSQFFPFIYPIFYGSEINGEYTTVMNHASQGRDQDRMYAYDIWFGYGIAGIPEHMPFSVQIMRLRNHKDYCKDNFGGNYNIWIRHPYTGYVCVLEHTQPGELISEIVGNGQVNDFGWGYDFDAPIFEYDPARVIANIGPKDGCSGLPHLHIECENPYLHPEAIEPFFGYDHSQYNRGLCLNGNPPCETISNIELSDFLLSGWVDPIK